MSEPTLDEQIAWMHAAFKRFPAWPDTNGVELAILATLERLRDEQRATGQKWQHVKSGGVYEVITEARMESTGEAVVVYRSATGGVWVRPADEFHDGRFVRVGDEQRAGQVDPDINPHVMGKYATQLDCLKARDGWWTARNAALRAENKRLRDALTECVEYMRGFDSEEPIACVGRARAALNAARAGEG